MTDDRGQPVVGAVVRVEPLGGPEVSTTTEIDGSYRLPGVTAGTAQLTSRLAGYNSFDRSRLYRETWHGLRLEPGDVERIDLVLVRSATLRGTIREADTGRPVSGACIQVDVPLADCHARSGPDGTYEVLAPAGVELSLRVEHDGRDHLDATTGPFTFAPASASTVDVGLPPVPRIAGRALDRFGRPVAGEARSIRGSAYDSITPLGDDGGFSFRLDEHRTEVRLEIAPTTPGLRRTASPVIEVDGAADLTNVDVRVDAGRNTEGTTDPSGDGATPGDPMQATTAGDRHLGVGPSLGPVADGYVPVPYVVEVGPPGAVPRPDTLRMTVDRSVLPDGVDPSDLVVFGPDGTRLPACDGGQACVSDLSLRGDDVVVTVEMTDAPIGTDHPITRFDTYSLAVPVERLADGWTWIATLSPAAGPGGGLWRSDLDLRSAVMGGSFTLSDNRSWFRPTVTSGEGPARIGVDIDTSGLRVGDHDVRLRIVDDAGRESTVVVTVTITGER